MLIKTPIFSHLSTAYYPTARLTSSASSASSIITSLVVPSALRFSHNSNSRTIKVVFTVLKGVTIRLCFLLPAGWRQRCDSCRQPLGRHAPNDHICMAPFVLCKRHGGTTPNFRSWRRTGTNTPAFQNPYQRRV